MHQRKATTPGHLMGLFSAQIATMTHKATHTPHIWLIWSSGTLYGLPLPILSPLLVVTSHIVLEVFARQLLLSGIVFPLTSILVKLSQHSADI